MIAVILLAKLTLFAAISMDAGTCDLLWFVPTAWPAVARHAVRLVVVFVLSATTVIPVLVARWSCRPRTDESPHRLMRRRMRAAYLRSVPGFWALAVLQLQVWCLGWPTALPGTDVLARWAESVLLVGGLLPLLAGVTLAWWLWYDVEEAIHPVPVGRGAYLWYRLRSQVGFVLVPLTFILVTSDLLALVGRWDHPIGSVVRWSGQLLVIALALAAMPLLVRLTWATGSLEEGPVRSMLEQLCRKMKVRYRDILLWKTPGGSMTNAAVLGLVGPFRYLLVTDGMLRVAETDELKAVFAHELGHVRKHHIPFFVLYIVTFLGLLLLVGQMVDLPPVLGLSARYPSGSTVPGTALLVVVSLVYWLWGFGFVSRRFERQADLHCVSMGISPASLISAFRKISAATGLPATVRSWRHFSLAKRIDFLTRVMDDPSVAVTFEIRVLYLKATLIALALLVWGLVIQPWRALG